MENANASRPLNPNAPAWYPPVRLLDLDENALQHMLAFLPVEALVRASATCTVLRRLGDADHLWKSICELHWSKFYRVRPCVLLKCPQSAL